MKIVAACALALYIAGCSAQTSHVTTVYSLYKSCIQGTMQGELNTNTEPKTPQEITEFAKEVDNICVDWTIIWFPSFSNDKDVSELRKDEIDRFNALRTSLLNRMIDEFTLYNKK